MRLAKSYGGKIFKNFTQKPPGKNIQGARKTQDRKNIKTVFKSHANVVTKWLPVSNRSLNRSASRINRFKKVSIALASGFYSFIGTKNYLH